MYFMVYRFGKLEGIGTRESLAARFGVAPSRVTAWATPSHVKSAKRPGSPKRYAVRVDEKILRAVTNRALVAVCAERCRATLGDCMHMASGCVGVGFCDACWAACISDVLKQAANESKAGEDDEE